MIKKSGTFQVKHKLGHGVERRNSRLGVPGGVIGILPTAQGPLRGKEIIIRVARGRGFLKKENHYLATVVLVWKWY